MTTYELTTLDIEKLKDLIKITNSLNNLYNDLEELDINGERESSLYSKKIEYLKITREVEENKYLELELTKEKAKALSFYILKELIKKDFYNNINSIVNKDYENRILRRILNNLLKEYLKYKVNINIQSLENSLELEKVKNSKFISELSNFINNNMQVQNNFEEEMVMFYIEFLENAIENEKNPLIKKELTKSKYFSSFIFRTIETSILETNFLKSPIVVNSLFEAGLHDISKERYDALRGSFALPYAISEIIKILEVKDNLYQDINVRSLNKIRQYFLRAIFLFMDDDTLEEINLSFHETLESEEYRKIHKEDIIGESLIKDCFKRIDTDRLEIEKLTLGYDVNRLKLK